MSFLETYTPTGANDLKNLREEGFQAYKAKGLPTPKTEDWRYADLSLLKGRTLKPSSAVSKIKMKAITNWPVLMVRNGALDARAVPGVEIIPAEKTKEFYAEKGLFDSPLERLNLAYADGGVCMKITKDFSDEGLELVFVTEGKAVANFVRNLIVVEEGVETNLFIRTFVDGEANWASQVTNFKLAKNARLSMYRDFEMAKKSLVTARDFATLEKASRFGAHALLAGLPSARYEVEAEIKGKGAHADLSGGLLAGEDNTIDVLTRVHHAKGRTTSNQTFKGVAGNAGKTAFQGRVRVEEGAQKIEAHQNCHNLILDRSGEANVKPELLIFADDVVCSHGATVGEVDESALFYMLQRGIPENEARAILIKAFLGEIFEGISDKTLASHFETKTDQWMVENVS